MYWSRVFIGLAIIFSVGVSQDADGIVRATIFSISPERGAVEGGTRVTIKGVGFSGAGLDGYVYRISKLSGVSHTTPNIRSSTIVRVGASTCHVSEYNSQDNQIVCYTAPASPKVPVWTTISVQLVGPGINQMAACENRRGCRFYYGLGYEQSNVYETIKGVTSGGQYRFRGHLRATSLDHFEARIGNYTCAFTEEAYADLKATENESPPPSLDDGVGGRVGERQRWHNAWWWCEVSDQPAGKYNTTILIDYPVYGSGRPKYSVGWEGTPNLHDWTTSDVTVFPTVSSVSPNVMNQLGGSVLTINGTSFDPRANRSVVMVGSKECSIISATFSQIKCQLGIDGFSEENEEKGTRFTTQAGSGLLSEFKIGNHFTEKTSNIQDSRSRYGAQHVAHTNYVEVQSGCFVPPITANYTFWTKCDDNFELRLSANESIDHLQLVAANHRVIDTFVDTWIRTLGQPVSSRSSAIPLQGGQRYAFESMHQQWGGGSWSYIGLMIEDAMDCNAVPDVCKMHSLREQQEIVLGVDIIREEQLLSFSGLDVYNSEFIMYVTSASERQVSESVKLSASSTSVINAARGLGLGCWSIRVESARSPNQLPINMTEADTTSLLAAMQTNFTLMLDCAEPAGGWPTINVEVIKPVALSAIARNGKKIVAPIGATSSKTVTASEAISGTWGLQLGSSRMTFSSDQSTGSMKAGLEAAIAQHLNLTAFDDPVEIAIRSEGGGPDGRRIVIEYLSVVGDAPDLLVHDVDLRGAGVTIRAQTLVQGNQETMWLETIPMDWFQQHSRGQMLEGNISVADVVVHVNGIASAPRCAASDCSVQLSPNYTAQVHSVLPSTATFGDTLEIRGVNLDSPSTEVDVFISGIKACSTQSASSSMITCTLAHAAAGNHSIVVVLQDERGVARGELTIEYLRNTFDLKHTLVLAGGIHHNELYGSGFSKLNTNVSLRHELSGKEVPCPVAERDFSVIQFHTPPRTSFGASDVETVSVLVDGVVSGLLIHYLNFTPTVQQVQPAVLSRAISGTVTVMLDSIPDSLNVTSVQFGERPCQLLTVNRSASLLSCYLARLQASDSEASALQASVQFGNYGFALPGATRLETTHRVDSISIAEAAFEGGNILFLHGTGFAEDGVSNEVYMSIEELGPIRGRLACEIGHSNASTISCMVPAFTGPTYFMESNPDNFTAQIIVRTNRIAAACSACEFTWKRKLASSCSAAVQAQQGTVQLSGQNLHWVDLVQVGGVPCWLQGQNNTALMCKLGPMFAGEYEVSLQSPFGTFVCTSEATHVLVKPHAMSVVSADLVSSLGGGIVTISGNGFPRETNGIKVFHGEIDVSARIFNSSQTGIHIDLPSARSGLSGNASLHIVGTGQVWVSSTTITYTAPSQDVTKVSCIWVGQHNLHRCSVSSSANLTAESELLVGKISCARLVDENNVFNCANLPAGVRTAKVFSSKAFGLVSLASLSVTISFDAEVIERSNTALSAAGGHILQVAGSGSVPDDSCPTSFYELCGVPMKHEIAGDNHASLAVPELPLVGSLLLSFQTSAAINTGLYFTGVSTFYASRAFDADPATNVASSLDELCAIGQEAPVGYKLIVERVRWYSEWNFAHVQQGARIEGRRSESHQWELMAQVTAIPREGWNFVGISQEAASVPWQAVRFATAEESGCRLTEIEIIGKVAMEQPSQSMCSLDFILCDGTAVHLDDVEISDSPPTVGAIEPRYGSARGGTTVLVLGNFPPSSNGTVHVALNGSPCTVKSANATHVICTSGPRQLGVLPSARVSFDGIGLAVIAPTASFRYLDHWSDPRSWRYEQLPAIGDTVVIPPEQAILMDVNVSLRLLLVQGTLIWDSSPENDNLELQATYIFVHGGVFEIGTEQEPFNNSATITLKGDRFIDTELPKIGAKCLAVMDRSGQDPASGTLIQHSVRGVLDIHGTPRQRTWTILAAGEHSMAGSTTISTSEPVDFKVGDKIVVTATAYSYTQSEERTVVSRPSSTEIILDAPLQYSHTAHVYAAGALGHSDVDLRGEVGLLNRNIVVQGDDFSEAQDFGGHTMAMGGGTYRVENAEFRKCGQSFLLGRYCTHGHMAGDFSRSYVKSNSIHHSFQRATTIHGVSHFQVKHNFAYRIKGHSFFVEDGAESFNVIEENLVAVTLRCTACLKGDIKPASFWTSSPRQFFRHNRAAGSTNDGFWFELPSHPHGPSFTTTVCPVHEHLGEFYNNTAHSNGVHGLRLYPAVLPKLDPCGADTPFSAYFQNFTSFRNGGHGVFGKKNGDLHHVNAKLVENAAADLFWTKLSQVVFEESNPHIHNVLFIGSIDASRPKTDHPALHTPQGEFFHVDGATFVNYAQGAMRTCAKCQSQTSLAQGGFTVRVANMRFINTPQRIDWTMPRKAIIHDLDGSFSGLQPGSWVTAYSGYNAPQQGDAACTIDTSGTFQGGIICDSSVTIRRVQIDQYLPNELAGVGLGVMQAEGKYTNDNEHTVPFVYKEIAGWVLPLVSRRWVLAWFANTPIDWRQLQIRYAEPAYIQSLAQPEKDWVGMTFNWTDSRYRNKVVFPSDLRDHWQQMIEGVIPTEIAQLGQLEEFPWLPARKPVALDPLGTGWLRRENKANYRNNTWSVILNTVMNSTTSPQLDPIKHRFATHSFMVSNIQCPPRGCNAPEPPVIVGDALLWSDPDTWSFMRAAWNIQDGESNRLPSDGDSVIIPPTHWVELDMQSEAVLDLVNVSGRLTFSPKLNTELHAHRIVVFGDMQVGTQSQPVSASAKIILHGKRASPSLIVDNSVFLSNKVIAVFGNLTVAGAPVKKSWVRLAQTAVQGSTQIKLQQATDWQVGNYAVLSSTEYDASQMERIRLKGKSADGRTLTLSTPLKHTHLCDGQFASIAANIDRNVIFDAFVEQDVASTSNPWPEMYGFHVHVGTFTKTEESQAAKHWQGKIDVSYARFNQTGKGGSEYAGLEIMMSKRQSEHLNAEHKLVGCVFSGGFNYGVRFEGTHILNMTNNVVVGVYGSGIFNPTSDAGGAHLEGNAVLDVKPRPQILTETQKIGQWIHPFAGIYLFSRPAALLNNVVSGSRDAGITVRPPVCDSDKSTISNNEVHSTLVGFFLIGARRTENVDCQVFTTAMVWKAAHIAFLTVDQSSHLALIDTHVSDSHIGYALNFFRSARMSHVNISDSTVIGQSPTSTCLASVECRAQSEADPGAAACNSEVGPDYRSVGIMLPQFTNRAKTCYSDITSTMPENACWPPTLPERTCNMPWERRHGLTGTRLATMNLQNVTFKNFAAVTCGKKSAVIKSYDLQSEFAVPVTLKRMHWQDVDETAKFSFSSENSNGQCATRGCDGINGILVTDSDGSTFGSPAGLVRHAPRAGGLTCLSKADWGDLGSAALVCPDLQLQRQFVFESLDRDRGFRRLEPVTLSRQLPNDGSVVSYGAHGPLADSCAKRFYFGQFQSTVQADGSTQLLNVTGTLPAQTRMHIGSNQANEGFVAAMFVRRPFRMKIYVGQTLVQPLTKPGVLPTASDPVGTNVFIPQANTLWITVRGTPNYSPITVVRSAEVQLDLTLAMSVDEFYGSDVVKNLAILLNIHPDQIQVASVQAASTVVQLVILPPGVSADDTAPPPSLDDTDFESQPSSGTATSNGTATPAQDDSQVAQNTSSPTIPSTLYQDMLDQVESYAEVIQAAAISGNLSRQLQVEILSLEIDIPSVASNTTTNSSSPRKFDFTPTLPSPSPSAQPSPSSPQVGSSGNSETFMEQFGLYIGIGAGLSIVGALVAAVLIWRARTRAVQPSRLSPKSGQVDDQGEEMSAYSNPIKVERKVLQVLPPVLGPGSRATPADLDDAMDLVRMRSPSHSRASTAPSKPRMARPSLR